MLFHNKNCFIFKINFYPNFFGQAEKQLDKKVKIYFKIYNVINRETNNENPDIVQILKFGQLLEHEKYFSQKIIYKMWWGI